mmetsp:Transcript_34110/g.42122  ORF Transcript_34110/g.42122 Transcript_34110/m.42122 type:complete len:186 (+) Transcript_34110:367-924(+)
MENKHFRWSVSYEGYSHFGDHKFSRASALSMLIFSCLLYQIVVTIAEKTSRFEGLVRYTKLHNVLLAGFSGVTSVLTFGIMYRENHFSSFQSAVCAPPKDPAFEYISFIFLLSKIWEWVDSILLVKKGKQLRFLHWFHHMTTVSLYEISVINLSLKKNIYRLFLLVLVICCESYFQVFGKVWCCG